MEKSKLEIKAQGRILAKLKSYLDRLGEIRVLSGFVDNGFDTDSAIEKVLAFET